MKTKRIYWLGVGGKKFKFDTIAERSKAKKVAKATGAPHAHAISTWHEDKVVKPKKRKNINPNYVKPEFEDTKYSYCQSVHKTSEGGRGTADVVRSFKNCPIAGVRFERFPSPYVGQIAFKVYAINRAAMAKAVIRLKELGYIDSIKEAARWIEKR